jgi:transcriptional repressor NrdR
MPQRITHPGTTPGTCPDFYSTKQGPSVIYLIMRCPYCGHQRDKVVDSRESKEGNAIRRRRQCGGCGRRFTSYERIDEIPYMVIKKGGNRERFDRNKVMAGLLKACEKRPVAVYQLEKIVENVERQVQESPEREISTGEIGHQLMEFLRRLDKVAYVRFASVYLEFKDVREFTREIEQLSESHKLT